MDNVCYFLQRTMDFEAAWLPRLAPLEHKIHLGIKLGRDALCLDSILTRLRELEGDGPPSGTSELRAWFDARVNLTDPACMLESCRQMTATLRAAVQHYSKSGPGLADAPTGCAFEPVLAEAAVHGAFSAGEHDDHLLSCLLANQPPSVPYTGDCLTPALIEFPVRPAEARYDGAGAFADLTESVYASPAGLRRLLHFVCLDIEIPAMEVCARSVVDYRWMPFAFRMDMARQCADEARHAELLRTELVVRGGYIGEYPYDCNVWKKYMSRSDLHGRLAVQQVVQEANGLDDAVEMDRELRRIGEHGLADLFHFIVADEVLHVSFGNKWLQYLTKGDVAAYSEHVAQAAATIGVRVPGKAPTTRERRLRCGFPAQWVERNISSGVEEASASTLQPGTASQADEHTGLRTLPAS